MKSNRSAGSAILFVLAGTVILSLASTLTFFLIMANTFELGYRDDILYKPMSFFISLSFLQALGTGIAFGLRRRIATWLGLISALISYVLLLINTLGCKGIPFDAVLPYAAFGVVSAVLLLLCLFCINLPAIVKSVVSFFKSLPQRIRDSRTDKELDARNLHNAADDEFNPSSRR